MTPQAWADQQKIELSSLSRAALAIRLLKWGLAASSFLALVFSLPALWAGVNTLGRGELTLWAFANTHAALLITLTATTIVFIADRLAGHRTASMYQETDILSTRYGADLLDNLVRSLEGRSEKIARYGPESGWEDPRLNSALVSACTSGASIAYELRPTKWLAYDRDSQRQTERRNRKMRYALQRKLKYGARLRNDHKIRLCTDLSPALNSVITLQQTDYLSSLMTDQLAFRHVVTTKDKSDVLHDGWSDFIRKSGKHFELLSLLQADRVSNQIGASTLAITNDGIIILVRQTGKNAQSVDRMAPSGSGSLDWEDLTSNQSENFLDIVRRGAARELIEECGLEDEIDPERFSQSHLLVYGFARMIHRAGKPEFFCVAALPYSSFEINDFKVSRAESIFTDKTINAIVPRLDWTQDVAAQISVVCRHYSDPENLFQNAANAEALGLSYPLHHGLDMLADLCTSDQDAARSIADFLMAGINKPVTAPS